MKKIHTLIFLISVLLACKNNDPVLIKSSEKIIEKFSFQTVKADAIIDNIEKKITVVLPAGIDITKLTPTIIFSTKAILSPASSIEQNFTKPISYTITAEDGTSVVYNVVLTVILHAPSKPVISKATSSYIKLEWGKLEGAKKYNLYRNGFLIYKGDSLTYEDLTVLPETSYSYSLSYSDDKEESPKSETLVVKTLKKSILDVVDDPFYAEYLPYEWSSSVSDKDNLYYYYLKFDNSKTELNYRNIYTRIYTGRSSEMISINYKFKILKDIIYVYSEYYKKYIEFYRIERINEEQFKAYSIFEGYNGSTESYVGIFYRKYFVEKSSDEVIKNSTIKSYISGIWKEVENSQSYAPDKNISYDFSAKKNFFWKNYETYDGIKKSEKYEFKIDEESNFYYRRWDVGTSWTTEKIKFDTGSNRLLVGSKKWFR